MQWTGWLTQRLIVALYLDCQYCQYSIFATTTLQLDLIFQGKNNSCLKQDVNPYRYQASQNMFLPWAENDIAVTEAAWGCIFMIISTFPRSNILMVPSLYPAAQCDGWMTASSAGWGCGWTVATVCPSFVTDLVGKAVGTGLNDTQLQVWKDKINLAIIVMHMQ